MRVSKKTQEDLLYFIRLRAKGETQQNVHLQKCTFCNWQLQAKASTRKIARLLDMFELFANCSSLQTNPNYFEKILLSNFLQFGQGHLSKSEDFDTSASVKENPRRSPLLYSIACQRRDSTKCPPSKMHLLQLATSSKGLHKKNCQIVGHVRTFC